MYSCSAYQYTYVCAHIRTCKQTINIPSKLAGSKSWLPPRSASELKFCFLQKSIKEKEFEKFNFDGKIQLNFNYISQANSNNDNEMMTRLLSSYSINYYIIQNGSTYVPFSVVSLFSKSFSPLDLGFVTSIT